MTDEVSDIKFIIGYKALVQIHKLPMISITSLKDLVAKGPRIELDIAVNTITPIIYAHAFVASGILVFISCNAIVKIFPILILARSFH